MEMSAWVFIWFAFPINLCSISGQTEKPPPNWWFFRFIHCHKRMPNCCIEGLFHICLGVTEFPIITIPMAISSTGRNKNRIKKIKQIEQKVLSNVWIDLQFRGEKNYIHNESCCIQCGWAIECMYRKAFAISNEIKKYCSRASVFLFLPRLWNCNGECIALERMFRVVYWISIKWKSMRAGERLKGKDLGSTKIEIVFNSPFMVNCSYFTRWLLCNWNDDGTLSKMYWKMWENRRKKNEWTESAYNIIP